jgi:hypothetical protein
MAQGVGPEFKPQYHKKKKEKENTVILYNILINISKNKF